MRIPGPMAAAHAPLAAALPAEIPTLPSASSPVPPGAPRAPRSRRPAPLRSAPPGKEGQWEGAGSAGSVPGGGWGEAAGELGCAATPLAINGGAAPSGGSGAAGEERARSPAQPSSYQLSPARLSPVQLSPAQPSPARPGLHRGSASLAGPR